MESVCVIDNTCRICFQVSYDTVSLYAVKDGKSLYDKLVSNTKLKVAVNDGGPTSMCGQCYEEMNICVEFLNKCDRADALFIKYKENNLDLFDNDTTYNEDQGKTFENDCTEAASNDNELSENLKENIKFSKLTGNASYTPAKHICQYCSKVFTRKFNLKLHVKRHNGEVTQPHRKVTRYACPAPGCEKSFTSITNLNTHIRSHNGERPYECAVCGKSFRSSTTLNDHKRIHTGVKPYMCPTCGKRFTTNKLSAHMRTHAAREHACGACPRRFASARAARCHAATHAPPRRLACALCPARYSHRQSLNKHVRARHAPKTTSTSEQTGFT